MNNSGEKWDLRALLEASEGPPEGSWQSALARAVEAVQDSPDTGADTGADISGDINAQEVAAVEHSQELDGDDGDSGDGLGTDGEALGWTLGGAEFVEAAQEPPEWEEDSGHDHF